LIRRRRCRCGSAWSRAVAVVGGPVALVDHLGANLVPARRRVAVRELVGTQAPIVDAQVHHLVDQPSGVAARVLEVAVRLVGIEEVGEQVDERAVIVDDKVVHAGVGRLRVEANARKERPRHRDRVHHHERRLLLAVLREAQHAIDQRPLLARESLLSWQMR
jgi:hypothetical protein